MSITGDGNVGIATETPTAKLEIKGDVIITNPYNTSSTLCVGDIGISDTTSSYGLVNLTRLPDDYERAHLAFIKGGVYVWQMGYLNGSNGFGIFNYNYTTSSGASPVISFTEDGNVGIGTSTPSSKFNVNGDTVLDGGLQIQCQYPSSPYSSYFYNSSCKQKHYLLLL